MFRRKSPVALVLVAPALLIIGCAPTLPPPPPPAVFEIVNLTIDPVEVEPGQEVTISAEVSNTGGTEGSYTAELKVDGVIEATKEVTVAAGASQVLVFIISRDTPGTYIVSWDKLSAEFIVAKPSPSLPKAAVRTVTWTDADATCLLVQAIRGAEAHFLPDNKVQLEYYAVLKFSFDCGVDEGKLWLGGVPTWVVQFLSGSIGEYTSYRDGKLFLMALPPWFDPTKELAPDVTELPTMESINTEEGEAIITYRWP